MSKFVDEFQEFAQKTNFVIRIAKDRENLMIPFDLEGVGKFDVFVSDTLADDEEVISLYIFHLVQFDDDKNKAKIVPILDKYNATRKFVKGYYDAEEHSVTVQADLYVGGLPNKVRATNRMVSLLLDYVHDTHEELAKFKK